MRTEGAAPEFRKYVIRLSPPELPMDAPRATPLDYTEALTGEVLFGEASDAMTKVGELSFQTLRLEWIKRDGFPIAELSVFDSRYEEFLPLVVDASGGLSLFGIKAGGGDLLFIDELSLLPEHRGRRLGGFIVERLERQYPTRWGALVVRAAPEPYDANESSPWYALVHARPFPASRELAVRRLRAYWTGFGFRSLGDTEYMSRPVLGDAPA